MPSSEVESAIATRTATYWTTTPIYDENEALEPPADGGPFLMIEYPMGGEEMMSIGSPGSNVFAEVGVVRFVLFVPKGAGIAYYRGLLSAFMANFRMKIFATDTIRTLAPSTPIKNPVPNGHYYEISAAVPYEYRFLG